MATHWWPAADVSSTSYMIELSLYVISPQFSIAPAAKSGIAIKSETKAITHYERDL
jgi:hypothetical protein